MSNELREHNNQIPWSQVIGLRNKIVHDYGRIDLTIIYDVLKKDLNKLNKDLKELIAPIYQEKIDEYYSE